MFPLSSKIWLINIVLAAVIVFFGVMSVDLWTKKDEAIPEVRVVKDIGTAPPEKRISERVVPPEATYGIVAEKNLFSPDRAESLSEESKSGQPDISEKRIFLYGVVNLGDRQQALISSPESGPEAAAGQAKDTWVRVGDTIGNFHVAEIQKDKIILTEGADRHEIFLHDERKPGRGQRTVTQPSAAPTVVVTGSEPAASAGIPSGDGSSESTPAAAAAPAPAAGSAAGKGEPEEEYKIVNTPFGPIKRRIK